MNPRRSLLYILVSGTLSVPGAARPATSLHEATVSALVHQLSAPGVAARATAAEDLGFLRAYAAADALVVAARDVDVNVRREACLSLAWCGSRRHVAVLLRAFDDRDWSVCQAAWVSLTNLTGMEFPYDAHADPRVRRRQVGVWRAWWSGVPAGRIPPEFIAMLGRSPNDLAQSCAVAASSTYKGPASVLTNPEGAGFWQTKNVPFPQYCTVDLGRVRKIGCVAVSQYGPGFCMTDYALEVSADGKSYRELLRRKGPTPPELLVSFPATDAAYVRIVSYASERSVYPTTFYRVRVFEEEPQDATGASSFLARERAMRALGSLGGDGAFAAIAAVIEPYVSRKARGREEKRMVQAGIRALGRLSDPEAGPLLVRLLGNAQWARYAADALGDIGDEASAEALIENYSRYAVTLDGKPPASLPADDKPGFEAVDRMYETPFAISLALARFRFQNESLRTKLCSIAPLLVVNMAGDYDGAMLYEEEAFQKTTAYLLERAGVRRQVCEIAFEALGLPLPSPAPLVLPAPVRAALLARAKQGPGGTSFAASWLTALCRDHDCAPRLIRLLEHPNGWVRINAAKTLMFMHERSAVAPIARLLKGSKTEAAYGTCNTYLFKTGKQGQDEYNAPTPCWREAYARALGRLGAEGDYDVLVDLLNDDRNALDVQYAAASALTEIRTPPATEALIASAAHHPFHSIRLLARESLWQRGLDWDAPDPAVTGAPSSAPMSPDRASGEPDALVFIKGSNDMPNDFQIDIWRQTYSTTDSGPTYRLGKNLYLLKPVATNGMVTPLTHFAGGYVADCEVSWDGAHVVFARREADNPWWHIFEVAIQGGEVRQLTRGPYHDVQPAYLPDGRIVFSSSRIGMRDEYHGYPATGLTVMNGDGTNIHCIGFNLGRDNEPAVMPDGRIVFSRLELFYSRLKTELTVQTVNPDGTMNQTIYGPERREFWHNVTRQSGERWWGEAPPRHRVLRLTQPEPLDAQRVIVATTGGATVVGPGRLNERVIPRYRNMAVTSPFPMDKNTVLCAATERTMDRKAVDLGLYKMDVASGALTLVYNDPHKADFEPRPVRSRVTPHVRPNRISGNGFTARLLCNSARTSREALTRTRGKLVRIIEGQPVTGRHHSQTSKAGPAWKNHVGTHARVLGTVPLAADGSFYVEIPADRLVHCQVLDSDRQVVGNQLIWMYARPGEVRSCVGCHEMPDTAAVTDQPAPPIGVRFAPIPCLPTGGEFSYRAKAWQKGRLSDETEERTRTVHAVSLPARP